MTALWLSPGLPAGHDTLAAALDPGDEVLPASAYPPPHCTAVVGVFERELLDRLVHRPADIGLVVVTPPGADAAAVLGGDLLAALHPDAVGPASAETELADLVRGAGAAPAAPDWWAAQGAAAPAAAPGSGGRLRSRRVQVAATAVVGLAIVGVALGVVASGGGSANATGGGGPSGAGGGAIQGYGGLGGMRGEGGGGGEAGGTLTSTQLATLEACLKEQGVSVTVTNGRPQLDMTNATIRAALQKCAPSGGGGGGAPPNASGSGQQATVPSTSSRYEGQNEAVASA